MRYRLFAVVLASNLMTGCTALSLERHTVNQATSVSALRYQEVVDNLAASCVSPGRLPAFSVIGGGAAAVSDTASLESVTIWDRAVSGFMKETINAGGKRNPDLNWILTPTASRLQLDALRCAYQWVIGGPPDPASDSMSLLNPAVGNDANDITKYHFGVADQLMQLPANWYRVGSRKEVPANACYVGHCGAKYVWVTPDGMAGLSGFTLVLLDIATVNPLSLTLPIPTATIVYSGKPKVNKPLVGTQHTPRPPLEGDGQGDNDPNNKPTLTAVVQAMQDSTGGKITAFTPRIMSLPPRPDKLPLLELENRSTITQSPAQTLNAPTRLP